jgi:hypothetical protein
MIDLGTLIPDPSSPGSHLGNSIAFAISNSGLIVGDAETGTAGAGVSSPVVFQAGVDPRPLFPSEGVAFAVNAGGRLCGEMRPPSRGFSFDSATGPVDLTAALGAGAPTILVANAINDAGQIAGFSDKSGLSEAVLLTP